MTSRRTMLGARAGVVLLLASLTPAAWARAMGGSAPPSPPAQPTRAAPSAQAAQAPDTAQPAQPPDTPQAAPAPDTAQAAQPPDTAQGAQAPQTAQTAQAIHSTQAANPTPGTCEAGYTPKLGQPGKDVVWLPTGKALVERMLQAAAVKPTDVVYDLGAGDGRIVIAAAQRFGARAVGVEYNPQLVQLARCRIAAAGLSGRARIVQGDLFQTPLTGATVVTLYLLPDLDLRLRPRLLALKPGTRIVSHSYLMGDWQPDQRIDGGGEIAWLWIVPAHVDGTWRFTSRRGHDHFDVTFVQTYQRLDGLTGDGDAITGTSLRGAHLSFALPLDGSTARVTGEVVGPHIEAKVTRDGHTTDYVGTRAPGEQCSTRCPLAE